MNGKVSTLSVSVSRVTILADGYGKFVFHFVQHKNILTDKIDKMELSDGHCRLKYLLSLFVGLNGKVTNLGKKPGKI